MSQNAAHPELVPELGGSSTGLLLRAHTAADLPGIIEQCRDPLTQRWTSVPGQYGERDARNYLAIVREDWERAAATSPRRWAVQAPDDSGRARFAGTVGYRPDGRSGAEIDFGLHPWARGRGLMVAAVRVMLEHAFGDDGVHTMRWQALRGNWGSRRVAWRCGFSLEGVLRGRPDVAGGQPADGWVGSLRHDEPRTPRHRWLVPVPRHGERVRLRPFRQGDGGLLDLDELAHQFVGPVLPDLDEAGFAGWLLRQREQMSTGSMVAWCLADPHHDTPWGWLGIFGIDEPFAYGNAEVGYWLVPQARGRGVLAQALELATQHAFAPAPQDRTDGVAGLGLHRLDAMTDARNRRSQAALHRAGWRHVGTEQDSTVYAPGGERFDTERFELLAEPRARQAVEVPVVIGDRIRLRAWQPGDVDRIVQACRDPQSQLYLPDLPWDYRQQDARDYVAAMAQEARAGRTVGWCVAGDQDQALGALGLSGLATHRHRLGRSSVAEVGYWMHPDARGQGLARRAVAMAVRHAFIPVADGGLGLDRLVLRAAATNPASQQVARANGFVEVGRDRQGEVLGDGSRVDMLRFDLLASEWAGSH